MRKSKPSTGIVVRHARACPGGDSCNCKPTYQAWRWDRRAETVDPKTGKTKHGKKIRKTFPTITAAKEWREEAGSQIRVGVLRASTPLTLRAAWEKWIEAAERGEQLSRFRRPYKPSALRGYRADMDRYVLDGYGAHKLGDIRADDLQALVDRLVGSGLSGSKVRNVLVPLQALYRKHRRQVVADPTDGLDLPAPAGRRTRVVSPVEAASLLEALPENDRAVWATAFYAGLRRGELKALRVSDVHADRVSIERSWDDYAGLIDTKSRAGVRVVPLTDTLRAILDAHVKRTKRKGDELLFGRTAANPFTPTHLADTADAAWATTKLQRVTLHECRHSFGSYLDAAGVSETRSARYLGHSLEAISDRYRHALPGQLAEDAAKLDAYLTGAAAGKVVSIATGAQDWPAATGSGS